MITKLGYVVAFLAIAAVGGTLGGLVTGSLLYLYRTWHFADHAVIGGFIGFVFANWAGLCLLAFRPKTPHGIVALVKVSAGFALGAASFLVMRSLEQLGIHVYLIVTSRPSCRYSTPPHPPAGACQCGVLLPGRGSQVIIFHGVSVHGSSVFAPTRRRGERLADSADGAFCRLSTADVRLRRLDRAPRARCCDHPVAPMLL